MTERQSVLSWRRAEYLAAGQEVPGGLDSEAVTEGILMSPEEVEGWFLDSLKTIRILRQSDPAAYTRVYAGFVSDVGYLESLGKLTAEDMEFVRREENMKWER